MHSITHRTNYKAKTQSIRTGTLVLLSHAQKYLYCFGYKRLLVQDLAQCRKIVHMYATKLLYTWVKQMSNANYVHRLHIGIVNIQYTWSQKFSSMPWINLMCINLLQWTAWWVSCYVLYTGRRLKVVSVSSYSHILPIVLFSLAYLHIYTSCTNQYGIIYILHCSCKCSMIMHVTSTSGNDTHCQLLSWWIIISARRPGTMLYTVQAWTT